MKQLEEEKDSRSDPDDPFNGTANGVFQPLQDPLSLPPPVQMPKRQGNNSKGSEHFQNSRENLGKQDTASRVERRTGRSPLRKENHMRFENILENRWIRWQVSATYTCSRGKTDVARRS